jgi:M6 family metalloprotease-like protein
MSKKIVPCFALLTLASLTSCSLSFLNSIPASSKPETSSASTILSPEGVTIPTDFANYPLTKYSNLAALQKPPLPSTGTVHILVLPVHFTNTDSFSASELNAIDHAYNGSSASTGWQSLQSFYKTSSYGKLTIEATLLDTYCYSGTDSDFQDYANKNGETEATSYLAYLALKNLPADFDYSPYDQNQDGYLDGFEMVYKSDLQWDGKTGSTTEVWWNYTTFSSVGRGTVDKPNVGTFFWSQYSLLANNYYSPNIDCHTLIHETGHMLGLNDYYSYAYEAAPAGMADMMDLNIGDHNAYSKMILGWVSPMIVDGSSNDFSLTLHSFTETGECVLLRDSESEWSETPFDEYLLLQYYTPTGLNEKDAAGYPEWRSVGQGGLYKQPGLQLFHVDSRLMNIAKTSAKSYGYTNEVSATTTIAASNTPASSINVEASAEAGSFRYNSSFRLFEAISANHERIFATANQGYYDYLGYQKALFGLPGFGCGSTKFSFASYANFFPKAASLNNGTVPDFSFEVTAQTASSIDLHFTKA